MSKIKDFFVGLNKSTKMTMLSCGCFVVLTFIILCFFVMFPITPSERAISSLGREGLANGSSESASETTTSAITSAETNTTVKTRTTTTTMITVSGFIGANVTTASGYLSGGVIPTGQYVGTPQETITTTIAPSNEEPVVTTNDDPPYIPPVTTVQTDIVEPVVTTAPQTEPPVTDPPVPPVTDTPVPPSPEE